MPAIFYFILCGICGFIAVILLTGSACEAADHIWCDDIFERIKFMLVPGIVFGLLFVLFLALAFKAPENVQRVYVTDDQIRKIIDEKIKDLSIEYKYKVIIEDAKK